MYSTLMVVLFCHFVSKQKLFAEGSYGYLIPDGLNTIPCVQNPIPDLCSFSHQVPDLTRVLQNGGSLTNALAQTKQSLQMISDYVTRQASKSLPVELCASSVQNFVCMQTFQLTCTKEYIFKNLTKIKKSCKDAEKHCGNLTNTQFPFKDINCSLPIISSMEKIKRLQFKCVRFPEVQQDPIPCSKRNYKILAINLTDQTRAIAAAHERLARYKNNISKECFHDVAEAICNAVGPACDKNETMALSLNSQQDCERIITCLNTTSEVTKLKDGLLKQCRSLPDATKAKKIPLSLIYSEFEGDSAPVTENITKVDRALHSNPATEAPFANLTWHNETQIADESSDSTESSFLNMAGENTSPTATTENPQTMNPSFLSATSSQFFLPVAVKPSEVLYPSIVISLKVFNITSRSSLVFRAGTTKKTSTSLEDFRPKTENLSNRSKSILTQRRSELIMKTPFVSATPSQFFRPVVNSSVILNPSAITSLIALNVTAISSSLVSSVGTTVRNVNVTGTIQSVSADGKAHGPENTAASFNSKMNLMAIALFILTLLNVY